MRVRVQHLMLLVGLVCVVATDASAGETVPTQVMVRVIARDAKIIGTKVGGARVTIRDASSRRVLAEGIHEGKTGDTELIMRKPRMRGERVFDTEGAAGFLATVNISEPTVVEILAEGPLGSPQATQRAAKTMLLVPGQHILGDGIILEIHGFTVEILGPDDRVSARWGDELGIRAKVTLT